MRSIGRPALVVAALAACGCEGCFEEARTLEIPSLATVTVPGTFALGGNPLLPEHVFPSDVIGQALSDAMQQTFSTEDVKKEAVESLTLTSFVATVLEPVENQTAVRGLGFLASLTVFLGAEGSDDVEVARSEDGAFEGEPGPDAYDFPVSEAELVHLLNAGDEMIMGADAVPANAPDFQTDVEFETVMTVLVDPIGALGG